MDTSGQHVLARTVAQTNSIERGTAIWACRGCKGGRRDLTPLVFGNWSSGKFNDDRVKFVR